MFHSLKLKIFLQSFHVRIVSVSKLNTLMKFFFVFYFTEESFPLLSDHHFIPDFHVEITQQDSWQNQGMCSCIQFAWALVLRSCSQWPNLVGVVEVLEEDEDVLDLAVDGCVFGFLRNCVVRASTFHHEVSSFQKGRVLRNSVDVEWMTWLTVMCSG